MRPFKLKIITPEKTFFEGETQQLIAKTPAGNVGILAGHTPYAANLVASPLKVMQEDGSFRVAAISAGMIKVRSNECVVVASAVEWADEIDVERAKRSKEDAERRIKEQKSQKEFERAEQKLKRALNRLTVSGGKY